MPVASDLDWRSLHQVPAIAKRAGFFPMGFPVEIETDSADVLAAARMIWARYPQLVWAEPIRIRVRVGAPALKLPAPTGPSQTRFDAEWISVDFESQAGEANCARANLDEGWGEIDLTADRAADRGYLNYHFLEPLAYLLLAPRHYTFAHASCVALDGRA
jgi:hypothetical protein